MDRWVQGNIKVHLEVGEFISNNKLGEWAIALLEIYNIVKNLAGGLERWLCSIEYSLLLQRPWVQFLATAR